VRLLSGALLRQNRVGDVALTNFDCVPHRSIYNTFCIDRYETHLGLKGESNTMARPREFDERKVLGAASDASWARGYEATSTRDLVKGPG
jgi:hypothetical protein